INLRTVPMNPFERHGIGHLSPSSLALFRNSPALWCLKYLWHVQDDEMPFAWRGKAVEAAVDAIVMDNESDDSATELAMAVFESEAGGELTQEVNRERNAIPDMVRRASPLFRRLGKPIARQRRVEVWLDAIEVPVIGFADYEYGTAI